MTKEEKRVATYYAAHDPHKFYQWGRWLCKRQEVLAMDRGECQRCRQVYHRYRRATTVHHVNHFKKRPDLALEIWFDKWDMKTKTFVKERNLVSLCHDCHEEVHGFRKKNREAPLTRERWD